MNTRALLARYADLALPDYGHNQPEGAAFINHLAQSAIDGIEMRFVQVSDAHGQQRSYPVSFVRIPIFGNHPVSALARYFASWGIWIAAVGNPTGSIEGPNAQPDQATFNAINRLLWKRCKFVCYKSLAQAVRLEQSVVFQSLPTALLEVGPNYWSRLSNKRRKDLQRHLKAASSLRREETTGFPEHLLERIVELYENTRAKSGNRLVRLNADYFIRTAHLSRYLLYFEGDVLIGFHQLLRGADTLCCKYVGMDYDRSKDYHLYFAMMIEPINICLREGIPLLNFGITTYAFKQHLGAKLIPTFNVFTHATLWGRLILPMLRKLLEPHPVVEAEQPRTPASHPVEAPLY